MGYPPFCGVVAPAHHLLSGRRHADGRPARRRQPNNGRTIWSAVDEHEVRDRDRREEAQRGRPRGPRPPARRSARERHDEPRDERSGQQDDRDIQGDRQDPQVTAWQRHAPIEREVVAEDQDAQDGRHGEAAADRPDHGARRVPELTPADLEPPATTRDGPCGGVSRSAGHRHPAPPDGGAAGASPACVLPRARPRRRIGPALRRSSRSRPRCGSHPRPAPSG